MAKSIRSKVKRKFRAVKRQTTFLPTEESRLQRVVDHSNGIIVPFTPKRFSFLVKNFPERGRQTEEDTVMTIDEQVEQVDEMVVEKKVLTKVERQALMMTRNQFKLKSRAMEKAKNRKKTQSKSFI